MEDNKEELPISSDQTAAIEKVKRDTEDIDFTKGVLTYVDVDFSECMWSGDWFCQSTGYICSNLI